MLPRSSSRYRGRKAWPKTNSWDLITNLMGSREGFPWDVQKESPWPQKRCWIQPTQVWLCQVGSITAPLISHSVPICSYSAWNTFPLPFPHNTICLSLSLGFLVKNKRDEAWNLIKEMARVQRKQPGIIIQTAVPSLCFWGKPNDSLQPSGLCIISCTHPVIRVVMPVTGKHAK